MENRFASFKNFMVNHLLGRRIAVCLSHVDATQKCAICLSIVFNRTMKRASSSTNGLSTNLVMLLHNMRLESQLWRENHA